MPLFFLPLTVELFEFNKTYLLLGLTSLGIFVWLAQMVFKEKAIRVKVNRFDWFVLGFSVIMILTVVFAKDKTVSVFGDYGRFWPSLIGALSLAGFYFLLKNNATINLKSQMSNVKTTSQSSNLEEEKEKQEAASITGILNTFLVSSGLVILTGLLSMFGILRKLFGERAAGVALQKSFNPAVFSLEGLAMFAGFLIILLVGLITFNKNKNKAINVLQYVLIAGSLATLLIVEFWPAWLTVGLGLIAFLGIVFWQRIFKEEVSRLGLPILILVVSLFFLFFNPLTSVVGESGLLGDLPSEVLLKNQPSWQVALQGVKDEPVLGVGIGNFSYAFSRYKPETLLEGDLWQLRLNRGGSFIAESVATTGILGVLAYLALLGMFLWVSIRLIVKKQLSNQMMIPLLVAFITLLIGQFVYYQNTVLAFSFWLMLGLVVVAWPSSVKAAEGKPVRKEEKVFSFAKLPELGLVFSIVFWLLLVGFAFLGFKLTKQYLADAYYRQYLSSPDANLEKLEKAAGHFKQRSVYHIALARGYLNEFSRRLNGKDTDAQELGNIIKMAVDEARAAVEASPNNVTAYETAGIIYRDIQDIAQGTSDWAFKSFEKALELEPDNPAFFTELGKLYHLQGEEEKAKQFWQNALQIKDNYTAASLLLAISEEEEGKKDEAIERLEKALDKNPWSTEGHFRLGMLYYNEGQFDLAEARFLMALQIFPNHSNSLYALALLFERRGDNENARKLLERVLQLNPDNQEIQDKIDQLGEGVVSEIEPAPEQQTEPEE